MSGDSGGAVVCGGEIRDVSDGQSGKDGGNAGDPYQQHPGRGSDQGGDGASSDRPGEDSVSWI